MSRFDSPISNIARQNASARAELVARLDTWREIAAGLQQEADSLESDLAAGLVSFYEVARADFDASFAWEMVQEICDELLGFKAA